MLKQGQMALLMALVASAAVAAETPRELLDRYEAAARQATAGFTASGARGEKFFRAVHGREWSCASCHTDNPAAGGRHAATGKSIEPLAPAANPQRFTRLEKAEKWFRRNCKDVLGRECSAAEKSDLMAYLMTTGKGGR